ncbi:MAG: hypothetical protein MZV64_64530 [Ignavibacteriales bacterium]|nr:hypothetical protein [Ignavibacteriales bacterium]
MSVRQAVAAATARLMRAAASERDAKRRVIGRRLLAAGDDTPGRRAFPSLEADRRGTCAGGDVSPNCPGPPSGLSASGS